VLCATVHEVCLGTAERALESCDRRETFELRRVENATAGVCREAQAPAHGRARPQDIQRLSATVEGDRRGWRCASAATPGPQARALCVAVLKSECIHRLDSHAKRGGFPHTLHSGDTAAHGTTACSTQWDGRGLQRVDKLACGLAKPMGALQKVLDSAFMQVR
jgi:hypothetical protein